MARLITPEAIASYPCLVEPNENKKYELTLIFEDGFPKELKQAALDTLKAKYAEQLAGAKPIQIENDKGPGKLNFLKLSDGSKIRLPWRDEEEDVAAKGYPEGSAFIGVRTSPGAPQPQVVSTVPNEDGKPTLIPASAIYPGCIVRASIDPYCYGKDGNQGVTFGLGNVQFIRDGERLDSRTFAQDDFDADASMTADLDDLEGVDEAPAAVGAEEDDLSDLLG